MAQIIAILNDKGGVAKTTTTATLGTALWLLGKKVLLIDTDQQCNLTFMMDRTAMLDTQDNNNLYTWFHDSNCYPIFERYPGFDFIPSSRKMVDLQMELVSASRREEKLKRLLSIVANEYDYIIIDCAPGGKNLVNQNVLVAADSIIIPTKTDIFTLQGTPNLLNFVQEIRNDWEKELPILGYLLVSFEGGTKLGREVKGYFAGSQQDLGAPLLPIQIHKCQRCVEAPRDEQTVFEYAPDCTAADDYMMLAERLCGIQPRKKNWTPSVWGQKAKDAYDRFIIEREE